MVKMGFIIPIAQDQPVSYTPLWRYEMGKVYIISLVGIDGESELGRFVSVKEAKAFTRDYLNSFGRAPLSLRIEDGIPPSWLETTSVE